MYSIKIRKRAIKDYKNGKPVKNICKDLAVSKSCIYKWLNLHLTHKHENIEFSEAQYLKLQKNLEKAEREKTILKEAFESLNLNLQQRLAIAEQFDGKYMTKEMCRMLGVNFSTFYNHVKRRVKETYYMKKDAYYKKIILKIYELSGERFGANKIFQKMKAEGIKVSAEKVSELMKEMNLKSKRRRGPVKSNTKIKRFYYKNKLKQNFNQIKPNNFWVGDVTYVILNKNKFYICVVMDLFSRKIIAYNVSCRNNASLTVNAFKRAFESRNCPSGLSFHSDQGSNYTSYQYSNLLHSLKVTQSFSKRGTPFDNAAIEAFFSNMKQDDLYSRTLQFFDDIVDFIQNYVDYYNNYRPHESLNFKTPNQVEEEYFATLNSPPF